MKTNAPNVLKCLKYLLVLNVYTKIKQLLKRLKFNIKIIFNLETYLIKNKPAAMFATFEHRVSFKRNGLIRCRTFEMKYNNQIV